jgi:hypothetical protein
MQARLDTWHLKLFNSADGGLKLIFLQRALYSMLLAPVGNHLVARRLRK